MVSTDTINESLLFLLLLTAWHVAVQYTPSDRCRKRTCTCACSMLFRYDFGLHVCHRLLSNLSEGKEADAYEVLGVEPSASSGEIKKRYWRLSLLIHPDKCAHPRASDAFQAVSKVSKDLQVCTVKSFARHLLTASSCRPCANNCVGCCCYCIPSIMTVIS